MIEGFEACLQALAIAGAIGAVLGILMVEVVARLAIYQRG